MADRERSPAVQKISSAVINSNPLSSSQTNNPLSKKLNKILETRLENDKDALEALKSLSGYFVENNIRTRRNLRGDIERKSININEDFIESFRLVQEQLDDIFKDVESMNTCCQDMTCRLKSAKDQTRDLINQTTKLQAESQKLQLRSVVADAFLAKFQLKPEELQTLRGTRDGVLHPDFFMALARVRQIHADCKILLRTNQQTAGLEIMESMALHQESAYERLYRWTQNECCMLTGDSPDISTKLCQALEALQDRPVLFRYTLDEFSNARRAAVVRSFIDALTRGGPGGTPRPIELHSHDPLRYLGDMLAWVHQGAASEEEHIQALLKKCSKIAVADYVKESLQHITEGICRPLKVRLEQVLMSEPGPVVLYKLTNLIKFYQATISQMLTPGAALPSTLDELHTLSVRMFFTSLTYSANKLLEKVELPPADLGPTASLTKMLQLLQDILSSHDSSVVALDERKTAFAQILSYLLDPLVQMCSVSASRLNTVDMATYMVNCLYMIQSTVALYEYTEHRLEMLQAQIDAHVDTLVSEEASYILNTIGLAALYSMVQQHQPQQGPMSKVAGMDPASVKAIMARFDNFLASADSLTLQQMSRLLSSKVRSMVRKRSVELVCLAYRQVYASMILEVNEYPDVRSLAPRHPDQIAELLS